MLFVLLLYCSPDLLSLRQLLHRKYVLQILQAVRDYFKTLPSLMRLSLPLVPKGRYDRHAPGFSPFVRIPSSFPFVHIHILDTTFFTLFLLFSTHPPYLINVLSSSPSPPYSLLIPFITLVLCRFNNLSYRKQSQYRCYCWW